MFQASCCLLLHATIKLLLLVDSIQVEGVMQAQHSYTKIIDTIITLRDSDVSVSLDVALSLVESHTGNTSQSIETP